MGTSGSPINRKRNGNYQLDLSNQEREVLRGLPAELIKQIEAGEDDGSMFRLFPPGYSEDLGRQVEFDRLMRDDLQTSHIEALRVLKDSADAKSLNEEQISAWLKALNQLRLVLGTRLDVRDDMTEDDLDPDDPRAAAFALYSYLGYLQDSAIEAISDGL
jgi:hypothetical protein